MDREYRNVYIARAMVDIESRRKAFEECNRWLRHIDTFYWGISSFLIGGNGVMLYKQIDSKIDSKYNLLAAVLMIFIWVLFNLFTNNVNAKSQYLHKRANFYEKTLGIDVVPEYEKKYNGKGFNDPMKIIFYGFIVVWGFIFALNVVEFFSKTKENNMKNNKVEEITPKEFLCAGLGCPSVFKTKDGEMYIIGKVSEDQDIPDDVLAKIGEGESVVRVPEGLISKLDL